MDKPIMKLITNQLDIKLRQFIQELNIVQTKIKTGKLPVLMKYLHRSKADKEIQ